MLNSVSLEDYIIVWQSRTVKSTETYSQKTWFQVLALQNPCCILYLFSAYGFAIIRAGDTGFIGLLRGLNGIIYVYVS